MGKLSEIFNFDNIGQKIKDLTKWSCWITILLIWIAAPIVFIILISGYSSDLWWIPIVAAIVAPFLIWIGCWKIYAYGELVDKASEIEYNTRVGERKSEVQAAVDSKETNKSKDSKSINKKVDSERSQKLEKLRSQGIITEAEYQQAISKDK